MPLPPRDLAAEAAKFFHGTAEERVQRALETGRRTLEIFHATLPPGTSLDEACDILRRNKHRGRRPSALMEAPRR
ncbi:MAG TPA: hypothetical protein VHQ65_06365 [Thermoanaerobaculia bacterium]|nr:hypothetical protein [Thermoanaerobaculia bacterium]